MLSASGTGAWILTCAKRHLCSVACLERSFESTGGSALLLYRHLPHEKLCRRRGLHAGVEILDSLVGLPWRLISIARLSGSMYPIFVDSDSKR